MFLPNPAPEASYAHLSFAIKYTKNMRPGKKTKWIQTCFLENAYNATTNETTGFTSHLLLLGKDETLWNVKALGKHAEPQSSVTWLKEEL